MACLKVLISTALFLAGSLGGSWFDVLETLQNAEYVLFVKGPSSARRTSTGPSGLSPAKSRVTSLASIPGTTSSVGSPSHHSRSSLMSDLDVESVRSMMNRLFDASKNLDDEAFRSFISALCKLSSEMINMQSGLVHIEVQREDSVDDFPSTPDTGLLSPRVESPHRRRASGIQLTRNIRGGDFGITRLGSVSKLNIHRLIYRDPGLAWNSVIGHLLSTLRNTFAPAPIRLQSAEVLDDLLVIVPRNIINSGDQQAEMQQRVFNALSEQVIFEPPQFSITVTEVRRLGLECLHEILQFSGHTLVTGWETIFKILSSTCIPRSNSPSLSPRSPSDQIESPARLRLLPSPLFKPNISLLRIAFQSLTLVCDSIDALSPDHLRLCITTLGQFGTQPDTNMALTAAESLMWGVSDSIQSKRRDSEKEPIYSNLWMFLLSELLHLCADGRTEVRNGSIQTLFRSLQLYGATLSPEMWTECLDTIIFPLFDSLSSSIAKLHAEAISSSEVVAPAAIAKEWYDTKSLAFQLVGSVFSEFLLSHIIRLASFADVWQRFVTHVTQAALSDDRSVTTAALRSLESSISASRTEEPELQEISRAARETAWTSLEAVGSAVANRRETSEVPPTEVGVTPPFSQESLLALADVLRILYVFNGDQWELVRLRHMMFILKAIMTYTKSPEYRPDIDKLTPVQSGVVQAVEAIKLTVPFSPSLLLSDLSDFATLAFVAAFDVEDITDAQTFAPAKQVTYIALAKYAMPKLVELYLSHKTQLDIYNDGTLARVLSSYSIPMKLKYDCPLPSKHGSEEPLWKTATTNFLKIVRELGQSIKSFGNDILPAHIEGIWRQALDVFRGALLADCATVAQFSLEKQDAEEKFDLALLATLEIDVIPYIGDLRVPDSVIIQLGSTLLNASVLHDLESHFEARVDPPPQTPPVKAGKHDKANGLTVDPVPVFGTTAPANLLPRERFKYWCFDLLFLTCSASTHDQAAERQRIAALALPSLLNRCHTVLATYVVDEALRGGVPFPRVREEELLYVLRKLQELHLWRGCLWASFSDNPSKYSINVPDIDATLEPQKMIADATKRSSQGHLFHFYTLLYEIATIHRAPPSMWVNSTSPPHSPPASDPSLKHSKLNGLKRKDKDKSKNKSHSATESIHKQRGTIGAGVEGEDDAPGTVVEVDARILAKDCLRQIGREMGAEI